VGGGADEIGAFDTWMTGLVSERKDVEEVVGDTEDGSVGEVELFFPLNQRWSG